MLRQVIPSNRAFQIGLASLGAFIVVLFFVLPGLGQRHLWQDEIETAERARAILSFGVPTVVDPAGNISLNTGGLEIEDGRLHRYSTWLQFYVGALGLVAFKYGDDTDRQASDRAIRLPFAILHAGSSAVLAYGLSSLGSVHPIMAFAIASLYGGQSLRLVHARTARYHSLLDFLFVVGLVLIGLVRKSEFVFRRPLAWSLAVVIAILPHVQQMGGSALALLLGLTFGLSSVFNPASSLTFSRIYWWSRVRPFVLPILIFGLISLAGLLLLTRPWLQGHWRLGVSTAFRSLQYSPATMYALCSIGLMCATFVGHRMWRWVAVLTTILGSTTLVIRVFDYLHPFSQWRYYYSLSGLLLFWMIPIGFPTSKRFLQHLIISLTLVATVAPEFLGKFLPYQGVRLSWFDQFHLDRGAQPLLQAFAHIRSHSVPMSTQTQNNHVLVNYVPQFANWYLPGYKIALLPDTSQITALNRQNKLWEEPEILWPDWHLSNPKQFALGLWTCNGRCDFSVEPSPVAADRYTIKSTKLKSAIEMCVVLRWPNYYWNNSPFQRLEPDAFTPEGGNKYGELVLAKKCD